MVLEFKSILLFKVQFIYLYMIKSRGINRKLLPLGIHLNHFYPIYEEKLLIKEIILFETIKKIIKYLIITPSHRPAHYVYLQVEFFVQVGFNVDGFY